MKNTRTSKQKRYINENDLIAEQKFIKPQRPVGYQQPINMYLIEGPEWEKSENTKKIWEKSSLN
jgi:hypothetical protein